ncbi:hypothetical protein CYY_001524 [Polysphondylium violaceum]|uniref:GH18 domain-containing protein n=1 Tax=Polysphondylium violaceum TaxID=133409 RepID=A0A8J4Q333_9MYCE|nr:hypothetical protein CYY_001524 [Polysphondylium violaceum]
MNKSFIYPILFFTFLIISANGYISINDRERFHNQVKHPYSLKTPLCPCKEKALCQPITGESLKDRKEFYVFTVNQSNYVNYDWSVITTLAVFYAEPIGQELCVAHENRARVVYAVYYPITQLANQTYKQQWIEDQVELVKNNFLDGINIDFESSITKNHPLESALLTGLVAETTVALKSVNKDYQISVDIPYSPNCISGRCYDWMGLSQATDFLVTMNYDLFPWTWPQPCMGLANSPIGPVVQGMLDFFKLGISADNLVAAFPWYAYVYPCANSTDLNTVDCYFPNCNSTYIPTQSFSEIDAILSDRSIPTSGELWNEEYASPYFNMLVNDYLYQVWYDNQQSIELKVSVCKKYHLRGVAAWTMDFIDYQNQVQVELMWNALKSFTQ